MKVYVVRHGESETNLSKRWTGWLDVPLTEKGIADAQKAGKVLEGIQFDKVFSSDLVRAGKTAETALPGCEYATSALLREVNVGNIAGKPLDILTDEQRATIAKVGYGELEGETKTEFRDRISRFVKLLEGLDCENVAVFSHRGWMLGMLDQIMGIPVPRKHILCGNCAVAVYEFDGENWRLYNWINVT